MIRLTKQRWFPSELTDLLTCYPNMPKGNVLEILSNRTWPSITVKAARLHISRKTKRICKARKITETQKNQVLSLYCDRQLPVRLVAEDTGISEASVKRIVRSANVNRTQAEGFSLAYKMGLISPLGTYERTPEIRNKTRGALIGHLSPRKGITMEQEYGEERAIELKSKTSRGLRKLYQEGKITPALFRLRQEPEFQQKMLAGLIKKPNKAERKLFNILEQVAPGQWRYVGNGAVILGGFCPDFINCNGEKLIIELFGEYWHTKRATKWYETESGREAAFAPFGYRTLVIWQSELMNTVSVIRKINLFAGG